MDFTQYYEEICKQPILSKEEEKSLLAVYFDPTSSAFQKKKCRDRLISANLRFVFKKAKQLSKGDNTLFEELISAGNEGLLVGLDNFDSNQSVRFLSYAGWWVLQRQLKEMSKVRIVSLPIWKQQLSVRIQKLQDNFDRPLTIEELTENFPDVKEKDLLDLSQTRYLTFYFHDLMDAEGEEDSFSEDLILEDNTLEEAMHRLFTEEDVNKLLSFLSEDQANVLRLLFGLSDGKVRSYSFVAEYMDLTKEEVRKIKRDSLGLLRKAHTKN